MNATITSKTNTSNPPEHWKKEETVFTGDDLIDAYVKGKEEGKDEFLKILAKQFNDNIVIATSVSEKLLEEAEKLNIKFDGIRIKAEGITKFIALFLTNEVDFISDKFRRIYTLSRKLKNQSESASFYITFSFIPVTNNLNEKSLSSDGFFLKYEKE